MKESGSVRFLYNTVPGRIVLKALTAPSISKLAATALNNKLSALYIPYFVKKNNIDTEKFVRPFGGYYSFNEFFMRKIKDEYLHTEEGILCSPCDGLLTVKAIDDSSVFRIKHCKYDLARLLKDDELAKRFVGGTALIFRLTPTHYHRYNYCANGPASHNVRIDGILHCVRPIALERYPVFTENSREYISISSEKLGTVVQMEVGALLVGKIANDELDSCNAVINTEKGHFEFGGSTIIVLLDHKVKLKAKLKTRERIDGEIPVTIGEALL